MPRASGTTCSLSCSGCLHPFHPYGDRRTGEWRNAFTVAPALFAPYTTDYFANPHATTAEGVAQRALTNSFIAKRSEEEKAGVRKSVLDIMAKHGFATPETPCTMPYETQLVIAPRL